MHRKLWIFGLSSMLSLGGCDDGGDDDGGGTYPDSGSMFDSGSTAQDAGQDVGPSPELKVENAGTMCSEATAETDCEGPMPECLTELQLPSLGEPIEPIEFPGGVCTADCQHDAECGPGGGCVGLAVTTAIANSDIGATLGDAIPVPTTCGQRCTGNADCREGYLCNNIVDALSGGGLLEMVVTLLPLVGIIPSELPTYCLPEPPPQPDAGMTDAGMTDAGVSDAGASDAGDTDAGDAGTSDADTGDAGDAG